MDAPPAPSPPHEPPAYVYAANDERPRGPREQELCDRAASTDWLYMGASAGAFLFSMYADVTWFKYMEQPGARAIGPGLVGLTWGFTLGGGYLAQPKCNGFVQSPPPEGDVRTTWHLALALGMLSTVSAPMIEWFFNGPVPLDWSVSERRFRVLASAAGGFGGAMLPYLLPPKTWRAAKELQNLRVGADATGSWVSYSVRF